ncbi:MAG: PAS domain S-box protein, partial [Candidatus Bathyarchaeota archaeon]|nr:PAS domain S-box protein [Candidatus Bathyarchaeota archaeon]
MIDIVSSSLWIALVLVDITITARLALMYRKDHDERKLMFIIGLLILSQSYVIIVAGVNISPIATRVFDWCPVPLLFAFIFNLFSDRFKYGVRAYYKMFLVIVATTIALFFVPLPFPSIPILLTGITFALVLAIVQYSRNFDLSSVILTLSLPSYAVCFLAFYNNRMELAIFSAFVAKGFLLLAFEVAKRQTGITDSALVLQKELESAKENFSVLFNLLPDPAVIVDHKGNFLEVTDSAIKATGFGKEEFLGKNFVNTPFLTRKSKTTLVKKLAKRLMGFQVPPYEVEIKLKDGTTRSFEVNASKIDYGGKVADLVVFRDLQERNKLLKSIAEKEERFRVLAQNTGDWVWEVDSNGNYVYTNSVVKKILGYKPKEIVGKHFTDLLALDQRKTAIDYFKSFDKKVTKSAFYKRCLHKSGKTVILETRGVPIEKANGNIVGYRGVDRDITEKMDMEKKLLKSERLAAVGELATMVAHDLRNPLQSIATAAYCLEKLKLKEKSEDIMTILQSIEESVRYSDKIVTELLDYSTKIKLEIRKNNPRNLVDQALSTILIPENVKIVNKTKKNPTVYVDSDKLRRVCVNIILNAIDAMPNGGKLTITSKKLNSYFELAFSDTGIGMSKDEIKRTMTPFFTTKAKGMG